MIPLLDQVRFRRVALGLTQQDMAQRIGMPRQQYQRMESKGNPRLDSLELVAKGLRSELMLIPQEKLMAVKALLDEGTSGPNLAPHQQGEGLWEGLLPEGDE